MLLVVSTWYIIIKIYIASSLFPKRQMTINSTIDPKSHDWLVDNAPEVMEYLKNCPPQDELFYQYNQYDRVEQRIACTLFNYLIILSSIFNQPITPEQEQEVVDFAIKEGNFNPKWGNSSSTSARAVFKRWNNKYHDKQAVYFQTTRFSEAFNLAIEKGLGVSITVKGRKDGANKFFKMLLAGEIKMDTNLKVTQGHNISLWKGYKFRDSDTKSSVAVCKKEVLDEMIKQWAVFPTVRIVVPLSKISKLSIDGYKAVQNAIQWNSQAWQYMDDEGKKVLNTTNTYLRTLI